MPLSQLLLARDTECTRTGVINVMLEQRALYPQQPLCLTAHRALMGCTSARLACCDQDMGTSMPGGDTPGEVPWSDAPPMELVSKDAPGRKPCTA